VNRLLLSNPALRESALLALDRLMPRIRELGEGGRPCIASSELDELNTLLEACATVASTALRQDLRAVQADLRSGELLEVIGAQVCRGSRKPGAAPDPPRRKSGVR